MSDSTRAWECSQRVVSLLPPEDDDDTILEACIILAARAASAIGRSEDQWLSLCAHIWKAPPLVEMRRKGQS